MMLVPKARGTAVTLLLPILAACCQSTVQRAGFRRSKLLHKSLNLSQAQISSLASLTDLQHMNEVLDNICIPRVVGTPGHNRVKQYIKSNLKDLGWSVTTDEFEDYTPVFGNLKFENIIAKWNPNARRFLVLACHYDSKYEKNYDFIGATDSAVPCMQLINLAKVMKDHLETIKDNDVTLMLLFFDGEEAFKVWGPSDSIYGARHLAAKWENTKYTYDGESDITDIDKIDLLVLLDLIGAPEPTFFNYFSDSSKWYSLMSNAETVLAKMKQFQNYPYGKAHKKYFQDYAVTVGIEDDHIPFLKRDVSILHVIPYSFPNFWHTPGDNRNAIDMSTIENINKILRVFVASYLNMQVQV